ncbi:MAG: phenylalanine--tRNA ligase subunit alpha [Spirochaetaceae bacterium]|nr:phenylalanine--tRNA ligase subunit alpha [Spirochaetaceae bacterium]
MDVKNTALNFHPLEVKVILAYDAKAELSVEKIEKDLSFKKGSGNQALSWLCGKGVTAESRREKNLFYEITAVGKEWLENGSPEERLFNAALSFPGALTLPQAAEKAGLEGKDSGSAFGALSKAGILALDAEKKIIVKKEAREYFAPLKSVLAKALEGPVPSASLSQQEKNSVLSVSKKRGAGTSAFRVIEKETVFYRFTNAYEQSLSFLKEAGISGGEEGLLTQEMLKTGSWKGKTFRSYNINVPPSRLLIGRSNPYAQFLENTKDKLVSLGFEEFDGPLVETEFWNSDALFMPQFHSARDIHDVYHLKEPGAAKMIDEPWLSRVAATHENGGESGSRGWNYGFDREFTKRLILRSQGTVMSAKTLPYAKTPGKYFGVLRCFRYDKVDSTHLSDFYQTEGIVLGENVNLKTLLGILKMFAVEVAGAEEIKYVPGYFPFTEPSIEVHIKHPKLGWFELGGSGIFRPEVTLPLGVSVPVAAWGIGIDRMALMALGVDDLRELFSYDLDAVRSRRSV